MSEHTFIGTLSQIASQFLMKFDKRLYLGQIFKFQDKKFYVKSLSELDDGRIVVTLKEK